MQACSSTTACAPFSDSRWGRPGLVLLHNSNKMVSSSSFTKPRFFTKSEVNCSINLLLPLDRNGCPKAWRFYPPSKWQSFVHLDEKPVNWHRPRVPKMFVGKPRFANPTVEWFYLPSQSKRLGCLAAGGWVQQCHHCDHPDFEFSSCWAHPNALFSYHRSQWPPTRHLESGKRKGNPRNRQIRWRVWPHPRHPGYWCRTPSTCCPYPHRQQNSPKERRRPSSPRQIARGWSNRHQRF